MARAAGLRDPGALRSLTLVSCGPQMSSPRLRTALASFDESLLSRGTALMWPVVSRILPVGDTTSRTRWQRRVSTMRLPFLSGMLRSLTAETDRGADLARAPFPTMVLHGSRDRRLWPHAEMAAYAGAAGARLEVVPECGHSPGSERPEVTAPALIGFWADTDRRRANRLCLEIMRSRPAADPYPGYAVRPRRGAGAAARRAGRRGLHGARAVQHPAAAGRVHRCGSRPARRGRRAARRPGGGADHPG